MVDEKYEEAKDSPSISKEASIEMGKKKKVPKMFSYSHDSTFLPTKIEEESGRWQIP